MTAITKFETSEVKPYGGDPLHREDYRAKASKPKTFTDLLSDIHYSRTSNRVPMSRAYSKQCDQIRVVNPYDAKYHEAVFIGGEILPLKDGSVDKRDAASLSRIIHALDAGDAVHMVSRRGHYSLYKTPNSTDTFDELLGRKPNWTANSLDCKWWSISSCLGQDMAKITTSRCGSGWLCNILMVRECGPVSQEQSQ